MAPGDGCVCLCSSQCSMQAVGTWRQRTCPGRCLSPLASEGWAGLRPRLQSLLGVWGSLQRWEQCCCHSVFLCWVRTLIPLIWQVPEVTLTNQTQKRYSFLRHVSFFPLLRIFHCYSTLCSFTHWIRLQRYGLITASEIMQNGAVRWAIPSVWTTLISCLKKC